MYSSRQDIKKCCFFPTLLVHWHDQYNLTKQQFTPKMLLTSMCTVCVLRCVISRNVIWWHYHYIADDIIGDELWVFYRCVAWGERQRIHLQLQDHPRPFAVSSCDTSDKRYVYGNKPSMTSAGRTAESLSSPHHLSIVLWSVVHILYTPNQAISA